MSFHSWHNTALIYLDLIHFSSFISFIWLKFYTLSYCRLNSLVHPNCTQNTLMPPGHVWISTIWRWMETNEMFLTIESISKGSWVTIWLHVAAGKSWSMKLREPHHLCWALRSLWAASSVAGTLRALSAPGQHPLQQRADHIPLKEVIASMPKPDTAEILAFFFQSTAYKIISEYPSWVGGGCCMVLFCWHTNQSQRAATQACTLYACTHLYSWEKRSPQYPFDIFHAQFQQSL